MMENTEYKNGQEAEMPPVEEETVTESSQGETVEASAEEPAAEVPAEESAAEEITFTEVVGVSFRRAGKVYYFDPRRLCIAVGKNVIVETSRGMEFGRVVMANKQVPSTEIVPPLRPVLRIATCDDEERNEQNRRLEEDAKTVCREKIRLFNPEMSLVDAEYTFDNSKLLFYFTAEGRVDFRKLVKELASVFKTRIELRQIPMREEAKLLGGLGICGRPLCCSRFLSDFSQISIKMAKEQNFSLNASKISGICGRLMCCLEYEHKTYEEALKTTPPMGSYVSTPDGQGTVCEIRPLTQTVRVRLQDKNNSIRTFTCKQVTVQGKNRAQFEEMQEEQAAQEAELAALEAAEKEAGASESGAENTLRNSGKPQQRQMGEHKGSRPPRPRREGQAEGERNEKHSRHHRGNRPRPPKNDVSGQGRHYPRKINPHTHKDKQGGGKTEE